MSKQLIDAQFGASRAFFQGQDVASKAQYPTPGTVSDCGYFHRGWERHVRESYQVGWGSGKQLWPTEKQCPGFTSTTREFLAASQAVTEQLLLCLSRGLGLGDLLVEEADVSRPDNMARLRMLHYPGAEGTAAASPEEWRSAPHCDLAVVTLLFQRDGQGGLEVLPTHSAARADDDAAWLSVPAEDGVITVNTGLLLKRWSDDAIEANLHRVRTVTCDPRYSIAYFSNASGRSVVQGKGRKYPAKTARELFSNVRNIQGDEATGFRMNKWTK